MPVLLTHEERSARVCLLMYRSLEEGQRGVRIEARIRHERGVHDRLLLGSVGNEVRRPV